MVRFIKNSELIFCTSLLFLTLFCAAGFAASVTAPTDTRITDNFSSLGIDQPRPNFAWILHDLARGQSQTAYQIMVVANTRNFGNKNNVVWDSRKVNSDAQYGVIYNGKPLRSTTQYWWKVRTWNKDHIVSAWSKPVSFVTAFLHREDWDPKAQWIRYAKAVSKEENPLPMFRKSFVINKKIKNAWFYIAGLGQFNSYLNGIKIGDHVLDPAWTDYDKIINYVTFDLTSKLHQGKNVIGVMLGNGLFANKKMRDFGPLVMIAQLHINFEDGSSTNIVSDQAWKAQQSPFTAATFDGSENYDARLAIDGWDTPAINDSKWDNAVVAKAPLGNLVAQNSPPVKVRKIFDPVKISSPAPGVLLYDFGQNMSGQFKINLRGQRGAIVKMMPGEDTTANGRVVKGRTNGCVYTLSGNKNEEWQMSFSSIGFRYIEFQDVATGISENNMPHIGKVNAQFVYTASRETGSFHSSDPRYNQIFDMVLNTLRSNMISVHTDGPNYERLGWQEVTYTLLPGSSYYFDLHNLYSKIVDDVRKGQRLSGLSPDIAPNYWATEITPATNPFDDSPAWGASMMMLPWQLYQIYGDSSILRTSFPNMKRYLTYLKNKETAKGVVNYGLGDWMAPGGRSIGNVEGAIYVQDAKIVYQVAALLKSSDAGYYKIEYERVKTAYNQTYYDEIAKTYLPVTQANLAIPLSFGIVPDADRKAVTAHLVSEIEHPVSLEKHITNETAGKFGPVLPNHITTGDIATTFLWRALGDAGKADIVQQMIMQEDIPSYWGMALNGNTTIPENWNYPQTRSHNHDMYAGIFEWFFKTLGGISASKPGFEEISLKPSYPAGLDSVSVTTGTVRGLIRSSWNNKNGHINWKFTVPVNSKANVYIPYRADAVIMESGKTIWINGNVKESMPGMKLTGVETDADSGNQYLVWAVGSGSYEVHW
ncbi:MAG: family 78 glycoside hydrolase catalytic domain [Bacteroidota bacterium]